MTNSGRMLWLFTGLALGVAGAGLYLLPNRPAMAAEDRFEEFVICTGACAITPRAPTDGVWLLDHHSGRLLGTVIDRSLGKIIGWSEVDLATQLGIPGRQNLHFVMTTGNIALGQAALYVAETTTGRFGVFTLGPRPDNGPGLIIRQHDLTSFRQAAKENAG
jgi:hypothetical protein